MNIGRTATDNPKPQTVKSCEPGAAVPQRLLGESRAKTQRRQVRKVVFPFVPLEREKFRLLPLRLVRPLWSICGSEMSFVEALPR